MTAEITIMNKLAIAMAADSAVTIGTEKGQKIYNSVNKLFTLSKYHPVGVMIYGSAELMRVPWETIIKNYRKKLGTRKFNTVKEYATDFLHFLADKNPLFPQELQTNYFISSISAYYNEMIKNRINSTVKKALEMSSQKKLNIKQIEKIVKEIIHKNHVNLAARKILPSFSKYSEISLQKKYAQLIEKAIETVFQRLPIPAESRRELKKIAIYTITRDIFSSLESGIVVAGFGERENFPALISFNVNAVVDNKLKYKVDKTQILNTVESAAIIPFAQSEMVATFIEGIDPALQNFFGGYLVELFNRYPDMIADNISSLNEKEKKELKGKLKKIGDSIIKDFEDKTNEYQGRFHINPILAAVAALPKDELAAMAESLVNLTSFKRRISLEAETVGGPIDVAVISKGDGFIWIKRKHYFKQELNQHFMINYYKD